jgi:hypothetical protein
MHIPRYSDSQRLRAKKYGYLYLWAKSSLEDEPYSKQRKAFRQQLEPELAKTTAAAYLILKPYFIFG